MKAAVYVRVSTDHEEQKQSLDNQRTLFMNLLKEKNWDLYDIYIDVETGTKANKRPELKRLVDDAKNKKFDIILAKELSRLARNGYLSYEIKNLAEIHGIHIMTLDGAINTLSRNTHMFGLYAWIYEQESQRTSERVKSTLRVIAKSGKFNGSIPPYGYYNDNGVLKIKNDFTPDVVRRIFKSYISGKGFDTIAKELIKDEIPTPSMVAGKRNASNLWHGSSVRKILENPHYTGDLVQQREATISVTTNKRKKNDPSEYIIVKNTHEAIISKEDFQLVQKLISERKRKRPYAKKHLFTNIMYCADCGKRMHYKANLKGYVCGSFNKYGYKICSKHKVKENKMIDLISDDLRMFHLNISENEIKKYVKNKSEKFAEYVKKRIWDINKEIERIGLDNTTILRMKIRGKINNEEYKKIIQENNKQINRLRKEITALRTPDYKEVYRMIFEFLHKPMIDEKIIHRLIKRIEIKEDGNPIIYYRFSDCNILSSAL